MAAMVFIAITIRAVKDQGWAERFLDGWFGRGRSSEATGWLGRNQFRAGMERCHLSIPSTGRLENYRLWHPLWLSRTMRESQFGKLKVTKGFDV
jgi:hypothetical protein